ncbi:uncharacterized protein LOC119069146 [Bradysia coprophila]|uniref:uncharacterized protein LOC119069146 n=1 Tax=Bradysia coprophila TaxID=38358 RepID=UPI00187D6F3E|nr:uncharacterized protein LOC119069146 [Bradysia coprophila]
MKFFVLLFVFTLSTVAVKAQSETNAVAGPDEDITKIQEKGLAILQIRILAANLPDDLQVKAQAVVLNAQIQLDLCKSAYESNLIIWQYKVCVITQLKLANIEVSRLESEAAARQKTDAL